MQESEPQTCTHWKLRPFVARPASAVVVCGGMAEGCVCVWWYVCAWERLAPPLFSQFPHCCKHLFLAPWRPGLGEGESMKACVVVCHQDPLIVGVSLGCSSQRELWELLTDPRRDWLRWSLWSHTMTKDTYSDICGQVLLGPLDTYLVLCLCGLLGAPTGFHLLAPQVSGLPVGGVSGSRGNGRSCPGMSWWESRCSCYVSCHGWPGITKLLLQGCLWRQLTLLQGTQVNPLEASFLPRHCTAPQ